MPSERTSTPLSLCADATPSPARLSAMATRNEDRDLIFMAPPDGIALARRNRRMDMIRAYANRPRAAGARFAFIKRRAANDSGLRSVGAGECSSGVRQCVVDRRTCRRDLRRIALRR